jgi:ribonuclease HI
VLKSTLVVEQTINTWGVTALPLKRISSRLRLNPEKCVFGVRKGKILGYLVSHRGIEANPTKIQAIINMTPP